MTTYRIKDVARINRTTLPEDTNPDFRFRYVDISAVDSLGNITVPEEDTVFASAPSRARRIAPAGSVLVSTVRTYLQAIGTVPARMEPLVFSTGFAVLEAERNIHGRYLAFYCRSQPFIDGIVARSTGVSYPAISASEIGNLSVSLPPLEEQRRIADFLDAETSRIDGLVDAELRVVDRLAERRAAGVQYAVSGGEYVRRRESTLAWLKSVPESWQEVRVGLLARMGSGHTPSRSRPEWWVECTIPWITTGEVKQVRDDRVEDLYETRERISKLGLSNSAAELHRKGTVFLCRTASAGYSGVMGTDMATSQDFVTWACGPRLNPYYLLWCLRAMRADLLGRLAMGSTHKTIYVPDLQMLRIPLPSLTEQGQIVETIRNQNARIDVLTDKVRRQVELLKERRQALITAAVTGQFDVSTASGRNVTDGVTV
ncbi:restriction endonuclease subunit S [Streptomyces platensis]|uniref:EcoKI restriction-modification system protein HsdS n=1 Tax=Streptomyces platensis TaxID=58346 RepID=A0AAE6NNQ3_STRPT|nr:restriction endonuclease subunit S [Streptomyces platensis]OSY36319.1 EcoKI restriction-modification system protein HsdS [Streptomyces platensis]QEV55160.1 restriction endonuclease subunit S [Streptomyces platensis]